MNRIEVITYSDAKDLQDSINEFTESIKNEALKCEIKSIENIGNIDDSMKAVLVIYDATPVTRRMFKCIHARGNLDNIHKEITDSMMKYGDKTNIRIDKLTIHDDHAIRDLVHAEILISYDWR